MYNGVHFKEGSPFIALLLADIVLLFQRLVACPFICHDLGIIGNVGIEDDPQRSTAVILDRLEVASLNARAVLLDRSNDVLLLAVSTPPLFQVLTTATHSFIHQYIPVHRVATAASPRFSSLSHKKPGRHIPRLITLAHPVGRDALGRTAHHENHSEGLASAKVTLAKQGPGCST